MFGGGALLSYTRFNQERKQNTVRVDSKGKGDIGGPYELVDDKGKVRETARKQTHYAETA